MIKHILIALIFCSSAFGAPKASIMADTNTLIAVPAGLKFIDADTIVATNRLEGRVTGAGLTTGVQLTNIITSAQIDVRLLGLSGTVTNDMSATLQNAIDNLLVAGTTLHFSYGTNYLNGVSLTKNLNINVSPGAQICWLDSATTNLFSIKQDFSGKIFGGGEIRANSFDLTQTNFAFIYFSGTGTAGVMNEVDVKDLTFRGYGRAAIHDESSRQQRLIVNYNRFRDGAFMPTNVARVTFAAASANAVTNGRSYFEFVGNSVINSNKVGSSTRYPSGAYVANYAPLNSFTTYLIADNFFYNVGEANLVSGMSGNGLAGGPAIDIYEDTVGGIVRNNTITNCYFVGIKNQNSALTEIVGNNVHTFGNVGISYNPGERDDTNSVPFANIHDNKVWGNGTSTYAINMFTGDSGTNIGPFIISRNFATNVYRGIVLNGFNSSDIQLDSVGPGIITDNIMYSTNNSTLIGYGLRNSHLTISGNTFVNQGVGGAVTFVETNNTLHIKFYNNTAMGSTWGARFNGVEQLRMAGNAFYTAAGDAIEIKQDAVGNLTTNLFYEADNNVISGATDLVYADIVNGIIRLPTGAIIHKRNGSAADYTIYAEDGSTPIMTIDTANSLMGIGPSGATIAGVPLAITYNTNELKTLLSLRNNTVGGAVGMNWFLNGFSGGIYGWDTAYPTSYRSNYMSWLLNQTASAQLELPTGSHFRGLYNTVEKWRFDTNGLLLAEQTSGVSNPSSGFGKFYVSNTNSLPYFVDDGGSHHLLANTAQVNYVGHYLGDLTTTLVTGNSKAYWIAPVDGTVVSVQGSILTASSSGGVMYDIHKNGTTILSTKITIDESERSHVTAATNAVISSANFSAGDLFTWDIDVAGANAAGPQSGFGWTTR